MNANVYEIQEIVGNLQTNPVCTCSAQSSSVDVVTKISKNVFIKKGNIFFLSYEEDGDWTMLKETKGLDYIRYLLSLPHEEKPAYFVGNLGNLTVEDAAIAEDIKWGDDEVSKAGRISVASYYDVFNEKAKGGVVKAIRRALKEIEGVGGLPKLARHLKVALGPLSGMLSYKPTSPIQWTL